MKAVSLADARSYVTGAASTVSSVPTARARDRRSRGYPGSESGSGPRKGNKRNPDSFPPVVTGRHGQTADSSGSSRRDEKRRLPVGRTADANRSAALAAVGATLSPESCWRNFPAQW